jgi:sarcosine oxidase subunit beta
MQAIVIGGGILGCSVGLSLKQRGFDVMIVDKHSQVGHGSTSASCAIVRRFYSQPDMIAMAHEGAAAWADWKAYIGPGSEHYAEFRRPGVLFIPPVVDATVHKIVQSMVDVGVAVNLLTAAETKARFPFLCDRSMFPPQHPSEETFWEQGSTPIAGSVFEADGGYIVAPTLAARNLREAGERAGVQFVLGREVTSIKRQDNDRFHVELDASESMVTDILINVAGPHSARINRMADVRLPMETRALRREVHTLTNPVFNRAQGPVVPVVGDLDGGIYFRPELGGRDLVVGSTEPACDGRDQEWIDDPDVFVSHVTEKWHHRQSVRLMKRFPDVRQGPRRGVAHMYDVSVSDWYPIVDKTHVPGYYVCIGSSGSSFKTAPVLGPYLAAIIEATENGNDLDKHPQSFRLERIGRTVSTAFLSRLRAQRHSTGTVIG